MADRLFEFLRLFWRNATVVLRWNVRVDRTSGPDCHLPLPFLSPMPRVHERPTRRTDLQHCRACFMPTLPGPSGAFVTRDETGSVSFGTFRLGAACYAY